MSWWRRIWCRHEHVAIVRTYSPPRQVASLDLARGTADMFYAILRSTDRALHGVTAVLVRCQKCGDVKSYTLLGKECDKIDDQIKEALAARTTDLNERLKKIEAVKPIYGASGSVTGFASEMASARVPIDHAEPDAPGVLVWSPKEGERVRIIAGRFEGVVGRLDLRNERPRVLREFDRCYYDVELSELRPEPGAAE